MGLKNVLENCEEVLDVVFRFLGNTPVIQKKVSSWICPSDVSNNFCGICLIFQIFFVSLQHPRGEILGSRMRFLLYPSIEIAKTSVRG